MPILRLVRWLFLALILASRAQAHGPAEGLPWHPDPWVLVPLGLAIGGYGLGLLRRRRRVGWRIGCHLAGLLALVLALVWPFEALSGQSLAAHMVQHLLLLVVAAPLLVLGRPGIYYLALWPKGFRLGLGRLYARLQASPLRHLGGPKMAFSLHALAVWAWHAPSAFEAALRHNGLHILEHLCFLGTAMLFWRSILHPRRARGLGLGFGAFWLLLTLMQSGLLGALITFASRPLYPSYAVLFARGQGRWAESALADQQLAGLLMWVPAGLIYLVAGLLLVALWLRRMERRGPEAAPDA